MKTATASGCFLIRRFLICILVAGSFLAVTPVHFAQMPVGGPPGREQMEQNNLRMLNNVRANPDARQPALARLRERLTQRGLPAVDARLAEIGKVFDEAIALPDAEYARKQSQLLARIMAQVAPGSAPVTARPSAVSWIDVHNHLIPERGDFTGAVDATLIAMDQAGITKMIIMPPPQVDSRYDCEAFAAALRAHPTRFAFLGGGGSLNVMIQQTAKQTSVSDDLRRQFERKAEDILRQGASGFGEIAIHHLSLHGADHPYESVSADHPLLLLLADLAARHDVPMDVHFDVVTEDLPRPDWLTSTLDPKSFSANLPAFERLLDHNPKAKICWAHAGSDNTGDWTAALTRRLLAAHTNLYMSLRLGPGHAPQNFPLTPDGRLKPEWLALFQDFPDRFVIGSDTFNAAKTFQGTGTGAELARSAPVARERTPGFLQTLPPDLARKIAIENARALYHLQD